MRKHSNEKTYKYNKIVSVRSLDSTELKNLTSYYFCTSNGCSVGSNGCRRPCWRAERRSILFHSEGGLQARLTTLVHLFVLLVTILVFFLVLSSTKVLNNKTVIKLSWTKVRMDGRVSSPSIFFQFHFYTFNFRILFWCMILKMKGRIKAHQFFCFVTNTLQVNGQTVPVVMLFSSSGLENWK